MSAGTLFRHIRQSFNGAGAVVGQGFKSLRKQPQVLIYPYGAIIFILLSSPIVGRFIFSVWNRVGQPEVIDQVTKAAPSELLVQLGLVTFSVFYTIFVTSYFTCMIAAATLAQLEGRSTSLLYGLRVVARRFFRVSKFALLAIFFLPMGIMAQRRKMTSPRGIFEAISSSFSLSMSQLAPAIVTSQKGVYETLRHSVDTLGQLWKESLVIRLGTFLAIVLLGSISFLPKLIENWWFDGRTAHAVGWIVTALLGASSYVLLRVISTVFTTTLYHQAKLNK